MKALCVGLVLGGLAVSSAAYGAGFAFNDNFTVLAPDQALAEQVAAKADEFRHQFASDWLGGTLPPRVGRVAIHVQLSDAEDCGLTMPMANSQWKFHSIWLTAPRDRVLGSTLRHELVHAIFATCFPRRLPAWADEGAASLEDDAQRIAVRRQILESCAASGDWPQLRTLLQSPRIAVTDEVAYSAAVSLTELLLSRGDKQTFLRFALAGREQGWNAALSQYYGLRSVDELQAVWQASVRTTTGSRTQSSTGREPTPAPSRPSTRLSAR